MGVLYTVFPLDDRALADPELVAWLGQYGIERPSPGRRGRQPTFRELRQALDNLDGIAVEVRVEHYGGKEHWVAEARDAATETAATVITLDFAGGEDAPCDFYFSRGSQELNLRILEYLSRRCGPLVMYSDDAAIPLLIVPGSDPQELLRREEEWSARDMRPG